MRPVCLLLIYFLIVFIGAALLAPWLFEFCQFAASHHSHFRFFAKFPFHRFVNRSILFLALLGLWPFLRFLGIRRWQDLGFTRLKSFWKETASGFVLGLFSWATLAATVVAFGARKFNLNHSSVSILTGLAGALLASVGIAVMEETLFRGALFGAFRKNIPWPLALILSSVIYALVHFFAKPESPSVIQWSSGFVTLASMLRGFGDFKMLVPGFFNLFVVGVILGLVFQRTGNLYFSIGLHAGWIFWLKSYGIFTDRVAGNDLQIWGSGKITDGWLATIVLLLVFGMILVQGQRPNCALDVA